MSILYVMINEHFARTLSRMMWVTFVVVGLCVSYYFMPEPLQNFIKTQLTWIWSKTGL
jgi:hypothetical protein